MTEAAGIIATAKPGFKPKVGVILGSGVVFGVSSGIMVIGTWRAM